MVKLFGKVTDYHGNPLSNVDVLIKDKNFQDIYKAITDEDGYYEIEVKKDIYYAIAIVRDYSVKYLEYWAWNVPMIKDQEINAKINGLEIYAINVFVVQGAYEALMIYFRSMSLQRHKNINLRDSINSNSIINISPDLSKEDIKVEIENREVNLLEINRVKEYIGQNKYMYSYLIQVELPKNIDRKTYNKVDIELIDRETGERGSGSVFWKE